jgi:UDP:flavonoid glycosyltransferase YjiC (YdhE family)
MKYLFCSPVTSDFLHPVVGLAQELQRRGHQVVFATGAMADATLAAAGLSRIPSPEWGSDSFRLQPWPVQPAVETDVRHLEHAARIFDADVLVAAEVAFAAPVAAERLGLPLCVLGQAEQVAQRRGAAPLLARVRGWFGLPSRRPAYPDFPLEADLFLLRTVAALEDVAALPGWAVPVGACAWSPADEGAGLAAAAGEGEASRPLVLADHRRIVHESRFWPELVEGAGGLPVRVAAAVAGWDERPALPAGWAVDRRVPLSLVPQARLVVSGLRSILPLAALEHGVPTLFVRGTNDLEGTHVSPLLRAGCAVEAPPEPQALGRALQSALDDAGLRGRAAAIGAEFARLRGFGAAADAVERLQPARRAAASA